jgi:hypothetical protein
MEINTSLPIRQCLYFRLKISHPVGRAGDGLAFLRLGYKHRLQGRTIEKSRFDCLQGKETFLFSVPSRPALGLTQSHIQWAEWVQLLGHRLPLARANSLLFMLPPETAFRLAPDVISSHGTWGHSVLIAYARSIAYSGTAGNAVNRWLCAWCGFILSSVYIMLSIATTAISCN